MVSLEAVLRAEYPRTANYDSQWRVDRCMGPHALWLLEDLPQGVDLSRGARVLDLGCGLGMTSTFLAREFEAGVTAVDLWVPEADNQHRFAEDGVADRVRAGTG